MMIEKREQGRKTAWARRWWQVAFAVLLASMLLLESAPQLSANAIYLITDGVETVIAGGTEPVDASRIMLTSTNDTGTDVILEAARKVEIRRGGETRYATSRADETVSALLQRESISVGPMEMVRVDTSGDAILLEIASNFTYYESEVETSAYSTITTTDYRIPKGETRVTTEGREGLKSVTYEVVYADGELLSRQAVDEEEYGAVDEVVSTGTLVREAQSGDTIERVIYEEDGSGYLILKSGDSLHFTGTMDVRCTAYNSSEPLVGTTTYTGTKVHVGVVAVDKSVIPLNTRMFITTKDGSYTYGMGRAEDTGVYGKTVDLYMNSLWECNQFGVRSSIVYFLDN